MQTYRKTPEALAKLSREQFRVTQQSGTEYPGTGEYLHNKKPGIYAKMRHQRQILFDDVIFVVYGYLFGQQIRARRFAQGLAVKADATRRTCEPRHHP